MEGRTNDPVQIIDFEERIRCIELSQYECSQNLACIALDNKIALVLIKFPEEIESGNFYYEILKEFSHESRCHAISFAPETSIVVYPKNIKLCAAGSDYNLRIYRSNLSDSDTIQILKGHTSYINAIAWETDGKFLASVSDDYFCNIWTNSDDFDSKTKLHLKSAGMSVKWHPDDRSKLLIAEKRGVIHLYNILTQQIVRSFEAARTPLMDADWSIKNRFCIAAITGGDIVIWDIRQSYKPIEVRSIHVDCGKMVRFSPNSEEVTASIGRPDTRIKIINLKAQLPQLEAPLLLDGGLGWHYRLPYIAVANDQKLCFWKVHTK